MSESDYTIEDFLDGVAVANEIDWTRPPGAPVAINPLRVNIGLGPNALEVAIASADQAPKMDDVRKLWALRWGRRASPVLLVVGYPASGGWSATVCGPDEDSAAVTNLDLRQVERTAAAALAEPSPTAAKRTLAELLVSTRDQLVAGLTNQGLFASHELRHGVPARADWEVAKAAGRQALSKSGVDLITALGYTSTAVGSVAQVLSVGGLQRAVAVLLDESEVFERAGHRFGAVSPVTMGLALAQEHNLPWLIVVKDSKIRLYPARPDIGVGRKGQSETYVALNLAHLADDDAAYLTLLFAGDALTENGTVSQILAASVDHATGLGERLRDRVYVDVVPALAVAVATAMKAEKGDELDKEDLAEAYHRTLVILFRLLFVAYAEDRGLLPYNRNPRYTKKALKTAAREFAASGSLEFESSAYDRWEDLQAVWRAVDDGNREWNVPAYNGGLFNADKDMNPSGFAISQMRLSNADIGPALRALLVDESDDGVAGPVDFRALSVREFGTIYEGLLESSLSIALTDLAIDPRSLAFVPAAPASSVVVAAGELYFHNASGARKASGSYFTKAFAVEHLLDAALEPALTVHLAAVGQLLADGAEADAAEKFFDFRVVDLAMGSGHFLVAAIDRIEARFAKFLAGNPIAAVADELTRLTDAAVDALGDLAEQTEIEPSMLLRRQIARRCIYGLDINLIAVELSRLATWIHTFVPGLPMSSLDHGLRVGNSLTGIGQVDEALSIFEPLAAKGYFSLFGEQIEDALGAARDTLARVAKTAEATKAEVREAARTHARAMQEAQSAKLLLDAAVALRLGWIAMPAGPDDAIAKVNDPVVAAQIASLGVAHMPYLFPEVFLRPETGFDVLLGNPPWDKVRHEPQQFWVTRDPGLNALPSSRRDQRISELRGERPFDSLAEDAERVSRETLQLVAKQSYSLQGSGHYEFAKLFVERALNLLSPASGHLGLVLPQSSLQLGGWAKLRPSLLRNRDSTIVQCRNSGFWLFDMDNRKTVVLLSTVPAVSGLGEIVVHPAISDFAAFDAARQSDGLLLTVSEVEGLTDDYVVPWFSGTSDGIVFERMKGRPSLASGRGWISGRGDSSRWDFSGSGRHRDFARPGPGDNHGDWNVFMTRHVDQYGISDDPFQKHVPDPALLVPLNRGVEMQAAEPRLAAEHPTIAYRFPATNDNSRTLTATALPARGYLFSTGYVHGISSPSGTPVRDTLALLGYMNSIPADWWARRFVDRHVGAKIVGGLPLPDWDEDDRQVVSELVSVLLRRGGLDQLPGGLSLPATRAGFADMSRDRILAAIDARAIAGFGMDEPESELLFTDFKDSADAVPAARRQLIRDLLRESPE